MRNGDLSRKIQKTEQCLPTTNTTIQILSTHFGRKVGLTRVFRGRILRFLLKVWKDEVTLLARIVLARVSAWAKALLYLPSSDIGVTLDKLSEEHDSLPNYCGWEPDPEEEDFGNLREYLNICLLEDFRHKRLDKRKTAFRIERVRTLFMSPHFLGNNPNSDHPIAHDPLKFSQPPSSFHYFC